MRDLREIGKIAHNPEYQAARSLIERLSGNPLPTTPFPAIITGHVTPRFKPTNQGGEDCNTPGIDCSRPWPNSPFVPEDPCSDDAGLDDCSPSSPANLRLPCGVKMTRYRWIAPSIGISSEGCGYRKDDQGNFLRWKQAFYAVNTAHQTQDPGIDYDYVPVNMLVLMSFGDISLLTDGTPRFGFFFHHMSDPPGANLCIDGVLCGCCVSYNNDGTENARECFTEETCNLIYGNHPVPAQWHGPGSPAYANCGFHEGNPVICDGTFGTCI